MPDAGSRYARLFDRLGAAGEGAFVPFTVLGDPDPAASLEILRTMARSGADALELGIPFSDPIADGPVIQRADVRALAAGVRFGGALGIVKEFRKEFPDTPVGLLVYANLLISRGIDRFYRDCAEAEVDSVLVVDVPTVEAGPFCEAAARDGVAPVLIAANNCSGPHLAAVAAMSKGYVYLVTRTGVTGADESAATDHRGLIGRLRALGTAPCLLGFGISRPEHARDGIASGAAGVISGSAVVSRIESNLGDPAALTAAVGAFVREMKAACRR